MIKISNISKTYGDTVVFKNLNLTIEKGQVFSLLGRNGAGKTTLINCLLNLVTIDSGEIHIAGKNHNSLQNFEKKKIGAVLDNLALIDEFSGYDFLMFVGEIYAIPTPVLRKRIDDLILFFFDNQLDFKKCIKSYSTGMRKKLAFCASVIHTPDILILDEPFSGLDTIVAGQIIHFIERYRNSSRIIFISSHDLAYVEKVSTHIGVLDDGVLQFNSTLSDFTQNGESKLDLALIKILKPNNSEHIIIDWL